MSRFPQAGRWANYPQASPQRCTGSSGCNHCIRPTNRTRNLRQPSLSKPASWKLLRARLTCASISLPREKKDLRLTVWVEMRKSVAALTGPPQFPLGLGYLTPAHKPRPLLCCRPSPAQSPESPLLPSRGARLARALRRQRLLHQLFNSLLAARIDDLHFCSRPVIRNRQRFSPQLSIQVATNQPENRVVWIFFHQRCHHLQRLLVLLIEKMQVDRQIVARQRRRQLPVLHRQLQLPDALFFRPPRNAHKEAPHSRNRRNRIHVLIIDT